MESGMNYLWFQNQNKMHGGDGLYNRLYGYGQVFRETIDPELDHKARKVSDKFSENVNIVANEPSLAFFRIQEHVRKTLPQLVEQKHEIQLIHQQVQGACFDTEYATNAVRTMYQSDFHFQNIQELLKNAMFMKQQIGYEETRRKQELSKRRKYTQPTGGASEGATARTESESSTAQGSNGKNESIESTETNYNPAMDGDNKPYESSDIQSEDGPSPTLTSTLPADHECQDVTDDAANHIDDAVEVDEDSLFS